MPARKPEVATEQGPALVDVLSAIHQPVRRRLMELLHLGGPATVSALAEKAGERVGNVSHHLRVLAEVGLVAEAPELAKDRRERWWRVTAGAIRWSVADMAGDPVGEVIASAAEQQNLAHHVGKVQQWFSHREAYRLEWVRAAFSTEGWISVTPEELADLGDRITKLIDELAVSPDRPAVDGRRRVFVFAHGVPAEP